jgi:hypothetical protein
MAFQVPMAGSAAVIEFERVACDVMWDDLKGQLW